MSLKIHRRGVLGAGAAALAGCGSQGGAMPGTLGGADMARGHLLRQPFGAAAPAETRRTGIAIIGGGVAGLAAAWALVEAGYRDFRLLELEDVTGGNARSGRNAISAYPLGAHYLPIPNAEAVGVRHLLDRLGIITGWEGGRPRFDPYQLVADPDERLLRHGRWQEGLVPGGVLAAVDREQIAGFFAAMARYRDARGRDGRPAFAIPMEYSSRDADLLALDGQSWSAWLDAQGWTSPELRAHIRYVCRDEYGTEPEALSAWTGIHYFAGRRGDAAGTDPDAVLTWPGGNGHLTAAMAARAARHIDTGHVVGAVRVGRDGVGIDALDVAARRRVRIVADAVVAAMPRFVAAHVVDGWAGSAAGFSYAPWVVANISVDRLPGGPGAALAWDNVSVTSPALGYVVATHQRLDVVPGRSVLTWYLPLSDMAPAAARALLQARPLADWQRIVHDDLVAMNPDLAGAISRIDVWRWGHAMVRPVPGFMWGAARQAAARLVPPVFGAHSDLSGVSIFEEAHYRGTRAAEAAMAHVGFAHHSVLAA
ncbi:MAG: FAD-dependent oxidoreductase [Polymorphobacter sp.]